MFRITTLLVAFIIFLNSSARATEDREIASMLVGTWRGDPLAAEREPKSSITYSNDGAGIQTIFFVNGVMTNEVIINFSWFVTNQCVVLKSIKSSHPAVVPVGLELRDRIISITPEKYIFESDEGYSSAIKQRRARIRVNNL
jgi:hypothetical protein